MAKDGRTQSKNVWPLPKFSFMVKIGPDEIAFQEVSGPDMEAHVIEYRAGNRKTFSTVEIAGRYLKAEGNEVAVETIEFAHDGITIANAA